MSKNVKTLCKELTDELIRLADCATADAHVEIAKTDHEQYVKAVEQHFLQLIPLIADIRAAHQRELALKAAA